ncbi:hypothetical protein [Aquimarina sp. 2201CG5-10]|uniref:hypothetical protein n=1 Tax=Aquimarina callyspongiae TaxID=3098150 RepID=UPI002AB55710|nr:hypothetical protein [Aquimarina sp. 2201CG5-10]MDY8138986.1 hypothetical protein [Aquimarina sp. 2201CG5-10]
MITSYILDFCTVEIYEDYLKVVMNEGVTVSPEHNNILLEMVERHFKHKAFLYITHRINSYSVNPTIYLETAKIPNLVGFAVVSDDPQQKIQAKIEKTFFSKEFKEFNTLTEALEWKDQILKNDID